jgi:hypothetical protein
LDSTGSGMTQEHILKSIELSLKAQAQAIRLWPR